MMAVEPERSPQVSSGAMRGRAAARPACPNPGGHSGPCRAGWPGGRREDRLRRPARARSWKTAGQSTRPIADDIQKPQAPNLGLRAEYRAASLRREGSASPGAGEYTIAEGTPGLARIVRRKRHVEVAARHADGHSRLDVDSGVRELAGCLGQAARPVRQSRRDQLDLASLVAHGTERLPGAGFVSGEQDDGTRLAARRPREAGDVDALVGDRPGHLGELAGLVLEVHDERVHGHLLLRSVRTTGRLSAVGGPVRPQILHPVATGFNAPEMVRPARAV